MMGTQFSLQFDMPPPLMTASEPVLTRQPQPVPIASGEKSNARDIIAAIRTLKQIEEEQRPATPEEKQTLGRFAGFGPVLRRPFSPILFTRRYKDASWQALGEELKSILTSEEYEIAKRTTFNAFYTSPTVIAAIHEAIGRLGVPNNATVLEPGCSNRYIPPVGRRPLPSPPGRVAPRVGLLRCADDVESSRCAAERATPPAEGRRGRLAPAVRRRSL